MHSSFSGHQFPLIKKNVSIDIAEILLKVVLST